MVERIEHMKTDKTQTNGTSERVQVSKDLFEIVFFLD